MSVEVVGTPMTTSILQTSAATFAPHLSTTWSVAAAESSHWKVATGPGGGLTRPPPPFPPLQARIAAHARPAGPIRKRLMSVPAAGACEHAHEQVEIDQVDAGPRAVRLQVEVRGSRDIARARAGPERPGEHGQVPAVHAGRRERSEERRVGKECRSRWSPYH